MSLTLNTFIYQFSTISKKMELQEKLSTKNLFYCSEKWEVFVWEFLPKLHL